jgi:hypothetical protein
MNRMSVAAALKAAPGRAGDTLSNFGQSAINFFDSMQRPTQGTIRIAGELVQVDEKGFNPATYYDRVSFSKEYFPDVTAELLKQHAALFKRVFNNEDYPMNPKNPLPPCNEDELKQITMGLKNRFKRLAEEIDVLEGTEHDTGVLRTKIKQLSRLKEFIYMLEKNAADDLCNPYGGAPTPGFGKDDAEENDKLRNTLRRFIIFLLQNKKRLDEYQNEYGSLADIVMPVIGDDKEITSETLSTYVNEWRKKHRSELPSLLIQILGITGEKSDLFEKKMQQELQKLADKIRKDVMMRTATGGGEVQEGGVELSDVKKRISEIMTNNTDPAQMITALVSYIVNALEINEKETSSLETQKNTDINKIKELAEKLKSSGNSLAFTQETMAKLQEAKTAAEKSAIELSASDSEKKNRLQLLETTYKSAMDAAEAVNKQLLEENQAIQAQLEAARATVLENSTQISEKAVELAALQAEYSTLKERFDLVFKTNADLQKQGEETSTTLAQLIADKVLLVDEGLRMRGQLNDLLKELNKTPLTPQDYPAALGFAKELGTLQAGGGDKELLQQIKGLEEALAAARAAQDETIKTKGGENAALMIQITGLKEQVANSLRECAARKCGRVIEIETKVQERDAKILELIKSLAEKEAVAAKLQSELTKCTDLSAVEKEKYEATIKSQLEQLSTMKDADTATILKLQKEGEQMLEKEKAATAAAKAEVKKKWSEILRLKSQIEGLGKNKLVDLAKRAAAASARPGSRPGTPKLPGLRPGSRPGTPKANGSRPGTAKANGSRPGTPKANGSRPGTPKANGSRPGTPKAAKLSATKLKAVSAFKAAAAESERRKAEEEAAAETAAEAKRTAAEAKRLTEEAAAKKRAADEEAAKHERDSRLAQEKAEREQTAEAAAAAAAAAKKAAAAAVAQKAAEEEEARKREEEAAAAEEAEVTERAARVKAEENAAAEAAEAAEAAAAAAAAEAVERARARAEEVAAAENAMRRTAAENAARSAAGRSAATRSTAAPVETCETATANLQTYSKKVTAAGTARGDNRHTAEEDAELERLQEVIHSKCDTNSGEPEPTSERTCTSVAAELKALATKTIGAKLNNKLPEAANIQKQKELGAESLRLGCSNEQSNPPVTPATPTKPPTAKPKIKTYEQIGASFEKTLRAILMQIKKGTGAVMAATITEDISQYGSLNKELKNSPIGKLIDSYKLQSEFFKSAPVNDPTSDASSEPWDSYFTKVWNAVWTQSITKKNLKTAPYPKTKAFLKKLIMDIFKAYIQQYNIEIDGFVNPDATLLEKASVVLPQFKQYVGDILIEKKKLYTLLGITDKVLTDYLST